MASRIQIVTGRHSRRSVVKIVTKEFDAAVKRSTSEVILPSGVHCKVKERMCFDFDKMETYWRNLPTTTAITINMTSSMRKQPINCLPSSTSLVVYTVTTKDTRDDVRSQTDEMNLCGSSLSYSSIRSCSSWKLI